jgi:protein-S-isoprenylcysteine O-methyltransferase Ste14
MPSECKWLDIIDHLSISNERHDPTYVECGVILLSTSVAGATPALIVSRASEPKALMFAILPPLAIALLMLMFAPPVWAPWRILGLVIVVIAIVLLTIARVTLGNSFSVMPQARKLVTTGIYSRIRNPIYVFSAVGIVGVALYFDKPVFLLLFVVLIPLQIMRARAEGRVLEERFGEEYRAYRARTWL